jgi:predicted transcriptional regulator
MITTEIQLPKVAQNRISRLAHASGRSPTVMLRFVLRDGFDAVELSINENAQADAEFAAGATVAHADVMRDALNAVRQSTKQAILHDPDRCLVGLSAKSVCRHADLHRQRRLPDCGVGA